MKDASSQSGRTMLEMLGVIAIIAIITIGGISASSYIDSYFRTNATYMEAENLATDVIDLYSWASDYSKLSMEQICSEEILSCTGNKAYNRWGGEIEVKVSEHGIGHASGDGFTITYHNVPEDVCMRLAALLDETSTNTIFDSSKAIDCPAKENDVTFYVY